MERVREGVRIEGIHSPQRAQRLLEVRNREREEPGPERAKKEYEKPITRRPTCSPSYRLAAVRTTELVLHGTEHLLPSVESESEEEKETSTALALADVIREKARPLELSPGN